MYKVIYVLIANWINQPAIWLSYCTVWKWKFPNLLNTHKFNYSFNKNIYNLQFYFNSCTTIIVPLSSCNEIYRNTRYFRHFKFCRKVRFLPPFQGISPSKKRILFRLIRIPLAFSILPKENSLFRGGNSLERG